MPTSEDLYALADLVATLEDAGYVVEDLDPVIDGGETGESSATLVLRCPALEGPADVDVVPRSATVTDSGAIGLELGVEVRDGTRPERERGSARSEANAPGDALGSDAAEPAGDPPTAGGGASGGEPDPAGSEESDSPDRDGSGDPAGGSEAPGDDASTPTDGEDELDAGSEPGADAVARGESSPADGDDPAAEDGRTDPVDDDGSTADSTDSDRPAHRDPERLEAVYDEDRTFPEMRDALGVDVTPQTVRKHMVDHGIHEPDSHVVSRGDDAGTDDENDRTDGEDGDPDPDAARTTPDTDGNSTGDTSGGSTDDERRTGSEGDDRSDGEDAGSAADVDARTLGSDADADPDAQPLPDGIGIHEHLETETVVRAVTNNRTLYEVQRALDLDRAETKQLLEELDLLDLVHGRLSGDGVPTRADVEDRIRTAELS